MKCNMRKPDGAHLTRTPLARATRVFPKMLHMHETCSFMTGQNEEVVTLKTGNSVQYLTWGPDRDL